MFAATQVAAATVTVRQHELAGSPVLGAMMWCTVVPPRRQDRPSTLEVARPPSLISTVCLMRTLSVVVSKRASSATPTSQPPSGAGPATLMSPPRLTRAPASVAAAIAAAARSAANAFAVAPRSRSTPSGTVTVPPAVSSRIARQAPPATGGRLAGPVSCLTRTKSLS